ncbi:MAG TPA: HAMP domain-containing sensor histidine kinase [Gaiellaceae bacterium]|nr:HAMP domain-containing sensor histidine kinase [Gaiellaceae bacterium]
MNPLRTVGGRLALALLVVVGGALAIVYLVVVSSYRSSLVNTRLKDMSHTVALIADKPRQAPGEVFPSTEWIEDEALPVAGGARVAVFSAALDEPVADSNGGTSVDLEHDPLVARAERGHGIVSSAVDRDGSTYAEAAVALKGGSVLLVASPLHSDLTSLSVVRRRVLVAVIAATVFAIVLGYGLATLFARRIRRLEAAAERIADGRFDEPVSDNAPDELGQLARAFEQMRLRLASLDRARGEFIANASHELRTPLFSLAGFLELLDTDENVDAETREEFLASMRVQVTRLTKLASDLLDLSRMDAGRLSVADDGFDLAVVADELVTEFGPRAAAGGHPLELFAHDAVYARGDETRVLQIGRILIDNAVVHTPPGTTIAVSVGEGGEDAALVVEDDGPGIPGESRQAVFDRFYRLGGSIASGSGLGLAIARELAELMGGRIELESRPGSTRFSLVLGADVVERPGTLVPARKG